MAAIVVGGGQAGLATSYHLRRRQVGHIVLEAAQRVGDSWRSRWDSLRLFTPARYDGLPGLRFPSRSDEFPTKNEMGSYLEAYASRFQLPVLLGKRVDRLTRAADHFCVRAGDETFVAEQVVVATGAFQTPNVPAFAIQLGAHIRQLHAAGYRHPAQLRPGPVVVVGAGNSGAEIAMESAQAGHRTYLAGRSTGEIPPAAYVLGGRLFWFFANQILSVGTPIGRKAQPNVVRHGGPLIRLRMRDVVHAGVVRTPRAAGVKGGLPMLEDGSVLDVANVVWCTGFRRDFSWIDLPILDADGLPRHRRGVVEGADGLYFVGLPFLTKLASAFIGGVGSDAARIADVIARRQESRGDGEAALGMARAANQ